MILSRVVTPTRAADVCVCVCVRVLFYQKVKIVNKSRAKKLYDRRATRGASFPSRGQENQENDNKIYRYGVRMSGQHLLFRVLEQRIHTLGEVDS